jgi:formate dehydrogenase maturation protein FdhE
MILFAIFAAWAILSLIMLIFTIHSNKVLEKKKKRQAQEASRLVCPDCGSEPMELIQEYTYEKPDREERVDGSVYHCCHCGHDEVIEKRWGLVSTIQRRYFHG